MRGIANPLSRKTRTGSNPVLSALKKASCCEIILPYLFIKPKKDKIGLRHTGEVA